MKQIAKYLLPPVFMFLLLGLYLSDIDTPSGSCGNQVGVNFRGIKFQFPITADKVLLMPGQVNYAPGEFITVDGILPATNSSWFMSNTDNPFEPQDTLNFFRNAHIYAVTFQLFDDLTDLDTDAREDPLLAELRRTFPGRFEKGTDNTNYINYQGCLTIIYVKSNTYQPFSTVSFCYGFTDDQIDDYVKNPG